MERLTNHFDYCKMIDCKFYDAELRKENKCKFFDLNIEHCHEKRMNDKLRDYEDLEEQGLLLKLPCKVGDVVYIIGGKYRQGRYEKYINTGIFNLGDIEKLGKTVFLTKAEAEKALAEMSKDCTDCRNYWQNTDTENECNGQDKPCHEFVEMAKKIHYSEDMKECPYCGSKEFYVKQSFKGTCRYNMRFDGERAENGEMYQYAEHTDMTKYAYCGECEKRLFPMEEYYKSLF